MLNTGDFAFDTVAGANVQILERIEMWGYTSYKVFNPAKIGGVTDVRRLCV